MKKYTVAGIVRARFEQIEQLMYEGMTQTAIVEQLNEELKDVGFETTVKNFRNELHRARKKREALGLGKSDPRAMVKDTPVSQARQTTQKMESVENPSGVRSLPPKPETKVYGGTPKDDAADKLF